ncbi:biotin-dependent carboxyltransferase family protein [Nakamurella sp.]|uniref:biotin-dependent carboxyltransferase family protein n=1 Tax=Nakamurella sp. TaxID=1869182 RepID=UPI0037851EF7
MTARPRTTAGSVAALTVVRPGPLALLQDAGRFGHAADGVGRSGPADRAAHARANRLVGNDTGATAVEVTLGGLAIRAEIEVTVAITGAPAPADVDGHPVAHDTPLLLTTGKTLRLRAPRTGLRSYLAVAGGIDVPVTLGSASTDTLAGLGPPPLAAGARLPVGTNRGAGNLPTATPLGDPVTVLRVLFGPRDDWFTDPAALTTGEWQVSPQSNRVGLRLSRPDGGGPTLDRARPGELPSEGLVLGAIQVPPSGQPVLFLADHPLTGGYPVAAVVVDADIDRAGQLRPGQRLRFVPA